jgi:hypothetical protein
MRIARSLPDDRAAVSRHAPPLPNRSAETPAARYVGDATSSTLSTDRRPTAPTSSSSLSRSAGSPRRSSAPGSGRAAHVHRGMIPAHGETANDYWVNTRCAGHSRCGSARWRGRGRSRRDRSLLPRRPARAPGRGPSAQGRSGRVHRPEPWPLERWPDAPIKFPGDQPLGLPPRASHDGDARHRPGPCSARHKHDPQSPTWQRETRRL